MTALDAEGDLDKETPTNGTSGSTPNGCSGVHGLGVFAKRDIPKGTVWWRARPGRDVLLINEAQFRTLKGSRHSPISEALLKGITTYSYYSAEDDVLILILDHARDTNHSDDPIRMCSPSRGDPQVNINVGVLIDLWPRLRATIIPIPRQQGGEGP